MITIMKAMAVATLLSSTSFGVPSPVVSALPFKGPAWISIEYPVNPYDATTKSAFLVVHAYHHNTAIDFPVSGTAEGIVGGERRTISLEFAKTTRPGVFALKKQWRDDGVWTLVISVTQGKDDVAQAVVELGTNGKVASVNVPTRQQGEWLVPEHVSMKDVDAGLRSRSAQLAKR